jgi:hypothetical protein
VCGRPGGARHADQLTHGHREDGGDGSGGLRGGSPGRRKRQINCASNCCARHVAAVNYY